MKMESIYVSLSERALLVHQAVQNRNEKRTIILLAGPPGSGKSTIADEVVLRLNENSEKTGVVASVLPMDGFHLYRKELDQLPNRDEAYKRRGAAWTFNADKLLALVKQLHHSKIYCTQTILAPGFNHLEKDPMEEAIAITPETNLLLVEGLWLLYQKEPWSSISDYADDTWFVDVDPTLARDRVARRHIKSGIEKTWDAAVKRAEDNDLRNGDDVRQNLVQVAVRVKSVELGSDSPSISLSHA
ncbi:uncharacterized protein PV09_05731 [Verruconis gallopava]|uniref:Phosphoribulokinase/uridine kinase domain-containing protein n=1 Tax=Verruconis gallopava TaxID=253628 RepID=A0A0D1XL46_9PEZI|nr:uncharacterized protein PV09_05731 [Verruconis gallopava]KIW03086.1 hypothetical protein PV09_05731 [Verruconis gallopava]